MPRPPAKFRPEPYSYHHELELVVESLTNLGHGVARDNGWVVMVPFALPGEKIRVRVFRNHKQHSDADLLEVLKPSPERAEPFCPLFTACGGCQYQHLSYNGQLDWKRRQVEELLDRLAGLQMEVQHPIGSPRQDHYRSKLTPHYERPRKDADGPLPIGFLRYGRRSVIDVPECPIATEAINQALPDARSRLRLKADKLKKGGTLLLRDTDEGVTSDNGAVVSETVGDITYRFVAGEFFQNNPFILPRMIEYVIGEATAAGLPYLCDAYSGVGVFALAGAKHFREVVGIEVSERAVELARENAELNQVSNVRFIAASAEALFADLNFPGSESCVIIDPPRRGCDEIFLNQLFAFSPSRVVYVSCDPATQARDTKAFLEAGYRPQRIQPFDLFPQTRHIENVITFSHANQI